MYDVVQMKQLISSPIEYSTGIRATISSDGILWEREYRFTTSIRRSPSPLAMHRGLDWSGRARAMQATEVGGKTDGVATVPRAWHQL